MTDVTYGLIAEDHDRLGTQRAYWLFYRMTHMQRKRMARYKLWPGVCLSVIM